MRFPLLRFSRTSSLARTRFSEQSSKSWAPQRRLVRTVRIGRASTEGVLARSAGTLLGIYSGSRRCHRVDGFEVSLRWTPPCGGALDVKTQAYDDAPAFLLKIAPDFDIWKVQQVQ